jgi:hypothetical protein
MIEPAMSSRAIENGSSLRRMAQSPLPRDYFRGPLLRSVRPESVAVAQAYREANDLVLDLIGAGADTELELANVPTVTRVEGVAPGAWRYEKGILHVRADGRERLLIKIR